MSTAVEEGDQGHTCTRTNRWLSNIKRKCREIVMNTPVGPNMNKQYREVSRCSTGPRVMHMRPHWKAENVKAQRTPTLRVEHGEGRTTRRARPYPDPAVTYYSFPPGGFRSPLPNLVANLIAMLV